MSVFVEPFCGSAAVTWHMLGASRPPCTYQGSKWRYARVIAALASRMAPGGFDRFVCSDAGPWGMVHGVLADPAGRARVLAELRALAAMDPREAYDDLHGARVDADLHGPRAHHDPATVAEFLFLQRIAFSGKAVRLVGGEWRAPGFNKTSAYGTPATAKQGAYGPQVPAMIEHIAALPYAPNLTSAIHHVAPIEGFDHAVEYLDPPYAGTTGYGATCTREAVVALALHAAAQGHGVIVSEAEPIAELVARGWTAQRLAGPAEHKAPFRSKREEWLTHSATPAASPG